MLKYTYFLAISAVAKRVHRRIFLHFFLKPLETQTEGHRETKTLVIRRLLKDLTSEGTNIARSVKVCVLDLWPKITCTREF